MKVRIVADMYLGYEVQIKRWYWPFWRMANFSNTFSSVEKATEFANKHIKPFVVKEWKI